MTVLGANINFCGGDGKCALYWAANNGNLSTVSFLLDQGADVNVANWFGDTPLIAAAGGCSESEIIPMITKMIQHRADINHAGRGGKTAIYKCAQKGRHAAAELLVESGADPAIPDEDGLMPAQAASEYPQLAAFLEKAADKIKVVCLCL